MSRFGRASWRSWARGLAAALLIGAAVFAVLAYGATLTWGYAALEMLVAGAGLLWTITWTRDDRPPARLLFAAFAPLAVALIQVAPLPERVVEWAAPTAWSAQQECRKELGEAPRSCLSVYPEATWRTGAQAAPFLLAAVAVASLAAGPRGAAVFSVGIGALGLSEWAIGLAFYPGRYRSIYGTWHDMLAPYTFWRISGRWPVLHTSSVSVATIFDFGPIRYCAPRMELGDVFGSFVVSNHFAGCLELCLPFAFGLWLAAWGGLKFRVLRVFGPIGVVALATGAVATVLFDAQSRAGAAGLVLAAITTLWADANQRRSAWRYLWLAAAVVFVFAVVGFFVAAAERTDAATLHRLATPIDEGTLQYASLSLQGRMFWWTVCWRIFRANLLSGVGLGGFGTMAPAAVAPNPTFWYFAHNDYAQLLAETGFLGLTMLAFVGWAIWSWRTMCRPGDPPPAVERSWGQIAAASGAAVALAAIALHSLVDWNLHVPANALLAALALGVAMAARHGARPIRPDAQAASVLESAARRSRGRGPQSWETFHELAPTFRRRAAQAITGALLIAGAWSAAREWAADRAIDPLRENFERPVLPGDDPAELEAQSRSLLPAAELAARGRRLERGICPAHR